MWESTVRLVGDDEAAHRALTQLKKAIRSRVTETELPEGSQLQLVSQTTSTVTAQLEQLAAVSGDTDQQRRQQSFWGDPAVTAEGSARRAQSGARRSEFAAHGPWRGASTAALPQIQS